MNLLAKILNWLFPNQEKQKSQSSSQDSPKRFSQKDAKMSGVKEFQKGKSVKITRNFYSTEFDCRCSYEDCTTTLVDMDHVKKLQKKRTKWNKPVTITSGYRCEKHNRDVGGATHSRHKVSDATDIQVQGMTPDEVADDCEDFQGLGYYSSFTHIDSRPGDLARWDFRKK